MKFLYMTDPIAVLLGPWASELNAASVLLRVVLSIVFSAIIGCERATKRHAAGLRTFVLVSLAATMSMILDLASGELFVLSAAVIIGIAVITTNTILYSSKNQIKGLTTSVGLWASSAVGLAVGAGFYTAALIAFLSLVCCLSLFPPFEQYLKNRSNHFEIHIELKSPGSLPDFVSTLRKLGIRIDDIEVNPAYVGSGLSVYSVAVSISSAELRKYKTHKEIIAALASLDYIYYVEEMQK